MDEHNPPSLRFCPFLNIPDSYKRTNPECYCTGTIKAVYSKSKGQTGGLAMAISLVHPIHLE